MPRSAARVDDVSPLAAFGEDVRASLLARPKRLPARWFYDALGSALFEAICRLPWYRITRSESALLARHAPRIVDAAGEDASLIELGGGSGEKLAILIDAAVGRGYRPAVHLIDVSARALDLAAATLSRFGDVRVTTHEATYEAGLHAMIPPARGHQLVLFLGSNIGNFDPLDATALLQQIAAALRPGDLVLLGADLVKPERELLLAYDDPTGVTAAFNKNMLLRINTELGAEIDLASFVHEARWNAEESRVEMHLVSTRRQVIDIPRARCRATFERGESLWTESSYKFESGGLVAMGERAGLRMAQQWIDGAAGFALTLFRRAPA
jgi:dimethylhistidine N-methyltransferase